MNKLRRTLGDQPISQIAIGDGPLVEERPQPNRRPFARRAVLVPAMLVVLVAVAASYLYSHRRPKFTNKDTIVLADLVNATGDPVFDGTLKQV